MYKHLLVPTDGSKLSAKAVRTAGNLAKVFGAKLTGMYVTPPYVPPMYGEAVLYVPYMTPKRYKELVEKEANKALAQVEVAARTARVRFGAVTVANSLVWQGIIHTAKSKKCDLIVMASHGRRGIAGLVLGSETTKVLTHSKTPVLVCR